MYKPWTVVLIVSMLPLTACVSTDGMLGGSGSTALPGTSALPGTAASAVKGTGQSSDLVGLLVNKLGVSQQQATGGAGSIFSLAKQRLNPSEFGQIQTAVPGVDSLIAAAPKTSTGTSGSALGSAGTALGAAAGMGGLGAAAGLAGSFQSLGMNSGTLNQFVPVVLDYVGGKGGTGTLGLMKGALGM